MRFFAIRNSALSGLAAVLLLALPASADPILSVTPTSIALSPTQTVLSFSVDPNGTDIAGLQLNLSALASGLVITSIQSLDGEISASGPTLVGGDYLAGFIGGFLVNRSAPFSVGTVTVEGLTPGTPLVLEGTSYFTDAGFNDIFVGPIDVATVVTTPEPTSIALVTLGLVGLFAARRKRI